MRIIVLFMLSAMLLASPSMAAGPADGEECGSYSEVVAWLKSERGETLAASGQTRESGKVGAFEVYTNPRAPSWSTVISGTTPVNGWKRPACIGVFGNGQKWRTYKTGKPARPTGQTIKKMSANPEENCGHYPEVIGQLKSEHGERLAARGRRYIGSVLEIFINPGTSSWSAVLANATDRDGRRFTCLAIFGEEWRRHK